MASKQVIRFGSVLRRIRTTYNGASATNFLQAPADPHSIPDAPLDDEHVHVGNEVDKLLVQGRKDEGIKGVLKGENYVNAVQQLARAGGGDRLGSEADWDRVRGLLDKAVDSMDSRHLAGTIAGLAQLGLKHEGLLGKASSYFIGKVSKLDPRQLVESLEPREVQMTELRNIDLPDGGKDIFGAVQARFTEISHNFTDELKQDLEWAEDKFGFKSQETDKVGKK